MDEVKITDKKEVLLLVNVKHYSAVFVITSWKVFL